MKKITNAKKKYCKECEHLSYAIYSTMSRKGNWLFSRLVSNNDASEMNFFCHKIIRYSNHLGVSNLKIGECIKEYNKNNMCKHHKKGLPKIKREKCELAEEISGW